ncbi:DUF3618 domain-containing protein [Streptomyces sp. NPDC096176]|uniref:DUF3618 domain-containing protein n=1 Tax=Streptomyces sp. NPDC096176 TaxID=3366079 RepID=UPI00381E7CCB
MSSHSSPNGNRPHAAPPSPDELRAQVEDTREQLGRTVEALAAKADVKARAQQTAAEVKEQAAAKAAHAKEHIASSVSMVGDKLRAKAPQPVQDKAHHAAETARGNPGPLLAAGAATAAILLLVVLARRRRRR